MLHLLLISVNRRTRNAYGFIKKGVWNWFLFDGRDDTAEKEEKQKLISNSKERTWSVLVYFIILPVLLGR